MTAKQAEIAQEIMGVVAVRLPPPDAARLRAQATRRGLRLSAYLRSIAQQELARLEKLELKGDLKQ